MEVELYIEKSPRGMLKLVFDFIWELFAMVCTILHTTHLNNSVHFLLRFIVVTSLQEKKKIEKYVKQVLFSRLFFPKHVTFSA